MRVALVVMLVAGAALGVVDRSGDRVRNDVVPLGPATLVSDRAFVDVLDVLVDEAGVWVLSGDEEFLTRIGPDGRVAWTAGAYGDGPNELRRPWVLIAGADGPLVLDPVEWRAVSVAPDSRSVRESIWQYRGSSSVRKILRLISHQDPFQVRAWRSGFVLARYDSPGRFPSDLAYGALLRLSSDGEVREAQLAPFGGSTELTPFLTPLTLWDVCDGNLVTVRPSGQVAWEDLDGARVEIEVEARRRTVSRDMAARYLREVAHLEARGPVPDSVVDLAVRDALAQRPRLVARQALPFTRITCASGSVWLNRFDPYGDHLGRGDAWLAVTPQGNVTHLIAPDGFRPLKPFGGRMYGTVVDLNGFQFIASIETPQLRTDPPGPTSTLHRSDQ